MILFASVSPFLLSFLSVQTMRSSGRHLWASAPMVPTYSWTLMLSRLILFLSYALPILS
jgi:hypothetical protein